MAYTVESQSPQASPQMPTAPRRPRPTSAKPPKLPKRKQAMHFTKPGASGKRRQNPRSTHASGNRPMSPDDRAFTTNRTYATRPNISWTQSPRPPTVTRGMHTRPKPKQAKLPSDKRNDLHRSVYVTRAHMNTLRSTALTLILAITAIILLGLYKLQLTIHMTW